MSSRDRVGGEQPTRFATSLTFVIGEEANGVKAAQEGGHVPLVGQEVKVMGAVHEGLDPGTLGAFAGDDADPTRGEQRQGRGQVLEALAGAHACGHSD